MASTSASIALPTATVAGLLAALSARRWPLAVPVLLALAGMVLVAGSLVDPGPDRSGPLGYANASAAVCVASGAAALQLALVSRASWLHRASLALMVVLLMMPLWFRSRAAGVGAVVVLAGLLPALRRRGTRTVAIAGAAAVGATALGTVVLGQLWQGPDTTGRRISEQLVGVRAELWHAALVQWRAEPVRGAGAFAPDGTETTDFRRYAHSAVLHVAAVRGTSGLLVLLAIGGLVVVALARAGTTPALVASLGVTALGLQASVDYVGHFALVLVVFAALVGHALHVPDDL